ncbi:MAG: AAA family ATPase [Thermoguttaceae bacterium]
MADDRSLLPGDSLESPSTAMLPAGVADSEWNGTFDAGGPQGPDLMIYVHALRRRWLPAVGLGLVLAGILGVGAWLLVGTKYTSVALLQVSLAEAHMFQGAASLDPYALDPVRFEIYKNTQEQRLLSRPVLNNALHKPEVGQIAVLKEQADPIDWLMHHISVDFPQRAEVMSVSVSRSDPDEALILVRAVIDSYMSEVVNVERELKNKRFQELESACTAKDQEMRNKREQMKPWSRDVGTTDTDMLTTRTKLILEELTLKSGELARSQTEIAKLRGEVAGQKALLANVEKTEANPVDLEMLKNNDPMVREMAMELAMKKMDQNYTMGTAKQGVNTVYVTRTQDQLKMLENQYNERVEVLRQKVLDRQRAAIQEKLVQFETQLKSMEDQLAKATKELNEKRQEAEKIGISSVELEMARAELKHDDLQLAEWNNEKEKLRIELRSPPRIQVVQQPEKPLLPSNFVWRLGVTMLLTMGGLCCPAVLLTLWDTRTRRINTTEDVSKGLRLPVIGQVPRIPSRVIRQLASPSKRSQSWHLRLTESVDGIAARLMFKSDAKQCRVIMVSSASGGEGKTTLATQLALSLARTGRRTVLVDFDLRRPSFDEVFALPLSPGVSELLRQQATAAELVHATQTDNLAVVTAGRWDRQALASLSNGAAGPLFQQLREEFSFVVVDTSPILPVADARFVSQLVDGVVLSVFRDVSEAPKIEATCEILEAFGVRSIEAVVTGSNNRAYGKHLGYEAPVTA